MAKSKKIRPGWAAWLSAVAMLAPISLGLWNVASMVRRGAFEFGEATAELLGAMILAIVAHLIVRLALAIWTEHSRAKQAKSSAVKPAANAERTTTRTSLFEFGGASLCLVVAAVVALWAAVATEEGPSAPAVAPGDYFWLLVALSQVLILGWAASAFAMPRTQAMRR